MPIAFDITSNSIRNAFVMYSIAQCILACLILLKSSFYLLILVYFLRWFFICKYTSAKSFIRILISKLRLLRNITLYSVRWYIANFCEAYLSKQNSKIKSNLWYKRSNFNYTLNLSKIYYFIFKQRNATLLI